MGYQSTVLQASQEAENGIVTFLRAQVQAKLLRESVRAANIKAVAIVIFQYEKGAADFNRYATIEQALVTQQDLYAQSQGLIAQGLVQVYRAMGGGWEIRCPARPGAAESLRGPSAVAHAAADGADQGAGDRADPAQRAAGAAGAAVTQPPPIRRYGPSNRARLAAGTPPSLVGVHLRALFLGNRGAPSRR